MHLWNSNIFKHIRVLGKRQLLLRPPAQGHKSNTSWTTEWMHGCVLNSHTKGKIFMLGVKEKMPRCNSYADERLFYHIASYRSHLSAPCQSQASPAVQISPSSLFKSSFDAHAPCTSPTLACSSHSSSPSSPTSLHHFHSLLAVWAKQAARPIFVLAGPT